MQRRRLWVHRPRPSFVSHLRRFSTFSRNGTPVGRGHALHRGRMPPIFALSHVPDSIHSITERRLLFPTSHRRSSIGLPYGRLAMRCTWRSNDFSTFHVIAFSDNLGGPPTPVALRSRAGTYETCNLATHANTRKHACDLLAPVGLYLTDGAAVLRLVSPYCQTLALNRMELPEGFSCRQVRTRFGTLSARLRTGCTSRNPHARVG